MLSSFLTSSFTLERIQTRFKGDCDHSSHRDTILPVSGREFRPDLKGIATCLSLFLSSPSLKERIQTRFKGDCDFFPTSCHRCRIILREFRPDLKGIATDLLGVIVLRLRLMREFRPDLKGIATTQFRGEYKYSCHERIQTRFKGDCD